MGVPVLLLGESGTGKSTSMRNFKNGELAVVNVAGKPLPFKGNFETLNGTTDFREIYKFMKLTKAKSIVIDDAQYIMSFQYMRRIKENGWDKFNELQSDFFNLIDCVKDLPADVIVYFLSHIETTQDGRQKIKTIGKMLDEKITIEGMFSIVLKTYTSDGKYYFLTQNSGNDTVKSPMGMFPAYAIDNDLKYVDEKIRNYYEIGEFLTDQEISEIDREAAKVDVIKDEVEGKKRRSTRTKAAESDSPAPAAQTPEAAAESGDRSGRNSRNRRSVGEELAKEREEVKQENAVKLANAGLDQVENEEEGVPFEEVKMPELTPTPTRRRRKERSYEGDSVPEETEQAAAAAEPAEPVEEPPAEETVTTRRRRRRE